MSNVALFNPSQAPAFAKNRTSLSPMARALAGGAVGNRTKSISIKGGVFRLNEGGKEIAAIEERYLDVVIVRRPLRQPAWWARRSPRRRRDSESRRLRSTVPVSATTGG